MSPPRRTHCKRCGRPMSGENLYVNGAGDWHCRGCQRRHHKAWWRRLAQERQEARPPRLCLICGRLLSKALRSDARICGRPECDGKARNARKRELARVRREALSPRRCLVCGGVLSKALRSDAKLCGRPECVNGWRRQRERAVSETPASGVSHGRDDP